LGLDDVVEEVTCGEVQIYVRLSRESMPEKWLQNLGGKEGGGGEGSGPGKGGL